MKRILIFGMIFLFANFAHGENLAKDIMIEQVTGCEIEIQLQSEKNVSTAQSLLCGGSGGGSTGVNSVIVLCESIDNLSEACFTPTGVVSVELVQQVSDSTCSGGRWTSGNGYIAVYQGCRAKFKVTLNRNVELVTRQCNSINYQYQECALPVAGNTTVWIQSRESDSACVRDYDWSAVNTFWTDNGCRATFASIREI